MPPGGEVAASDSCPDGSTTNRGPPLTGGEPPGWPAAHSCCPPPTLYSQSVGLPSSQVHPVVRLARPPGSGLVVCAPNHTPRAPAVLHTRPGTSSASASLADVMDASVTPPPLPVPAAPRPGHSAPQPASAAAAVQLKATGPSRGAKHLRLPRGLDHPGGHSGVGVGEGVALLDGEGFGVPLPVGVVDGVVLPVALLDGDTDMVAVPDPVPVVLGDTEGVGDGTHTSTTCPWPPMPRGDPLTPLPPVATPAV